MNNNDINFQPVFDYIDEKNKKLKDDLKEHIDKQITKSLKPIFSHIDDKNKELLDHIDERITAKIDPLITAMDTMIAETRKYHQELEVYKHQFQVLKDWAVEVSKKVGVPLPF